MLFSEVPDGQFLEIRNGGSEEEEGQWAWQSLWGKEEEHPWSREKSRGLAQKQCEETEAGQRGRSGQGIYKLLL